MPPGNPKQVYASIISATCLPEISHADVRQHQFCHSVVCAAAGHGSSCAVQNKVAYHCQRELQAAGCLHLCPGATSTEQSFVCGTLSRRATEQQLQLGHGF